jgi:outer membrane protein OmpA-like peptidoglycan-associated protein
MEPDIAFAIEAHVTHDELQAIATAIREPVDKTRKAISLCTLGIVGGLIRRAESDVEALLAALRSPMFGGVGHLRRMLLDAHGDAIDDLVARSTGMKTPSAHRVMGALLPIAASILARELRDRGTEDAVRLFRSQSDYVHARPDATAMVETVGTAAPHGSPRPSTSRWARHRPLRPFAVVLGAVLLAMLMAGRRTGDDTRVTSEADGESPTAGAPEPHAATAEPTSVTTITGADLSRREALPKHFFGPEVPDRFVLPFVTFENGSTTLRSGRVIIDELGVLMKEHPRARVRLEGYTDEASDELSRERALAVKKMLVDEGIEADRIDAAGMGAHAQRSSNDTGEGRRANPRIEAVIVSR